MENLLADECDAITREGERQEDPYALRTSIGCGECRQGTYCVEEFHPVGSPGNRTVSYIVGCSQSLLDDRGNGCNNLIHVTDPKDVTELRDMIAHWHDLIPGPDPKLVERFKRFYSRLVAKGRFSAGSVSFNTRPSGSVRIAVSCCRR
jgi:hypothetical protein